MNILNYHKQILSAILALSLGAPIISLRIQLIHGVSACPLCQFQRLFFAFCIGLSLWTLYSKRTFVGFKVLSLTSLIGCFVAAYHTSVQFGLVADRCRTAQSIHNLGDFQDLLFNKASCGQITWDILGIPLAPINAAFFGMVSLVGLILICQDAKAFIAGKTHKT